MLLWLVAVEACSEVGVLGMSLEADWDGPALSVPDRV